MGLAPKFEAFVRSDNRMKGENLMTEKLLKKLNSSGKMHAVPCMIKGQYVIRFTITSQRTTVQDLTRDWNQIRSTATDVLEEAGIVTANRKRVPLKDISPPSPPTTISPVSFLKLAWGSRSFIFRCKDLVEE